MSALSKDWKWQKRSRIVSQSWGMWIRDYCVTNGVFYGDFSAHFEDKTGWGCPRATAGNWLDDMAVPTGRRMVALAELLGMNDNDILDASRETTRLKKQKLEKRRLNKTKIEKPEDARDQTPVPNGRQDEANDYLKHFVKPGSLMKYALSRREQNFEAYWFADLFKAGMSPSQLAKELWSFSEHWPMPDLDDGGNAMGSDESWGDIYSVSPMTGAVIKNKAGDIVGFWHFIPVYQEFYKQIVAGENVNNKICSDDIEVFDGPGDYFVYLVDAFRDPSLDLNPSFKALFSGTLQTCLLNCAEGGEFVSKIVTHASTQPAITFCKRSGFRRIGEHETHKRFSHDDPKNPAPFVPTEIWELDNSSNVRNRFISKSDELLVLYAAHFTA